MSQPGGRVGGGERSKVTTFPGEGEVFEGGTVEQGPGAPVLLRAAGIRAPPRVVPLFETKADLTQGPARNRGPSVFSRILEEGFGKSRTQTEAARAKVVLPPPPPPGGWGLHRKDGDGGGEVMVAVGVILRGRFRRPQSQSEGRESGPRVGAKGTGMGEGEGRVEVKPGALGPRTPPPPCGRCSRPAAGGPPAVLLDCEVRVQSDSAQPTS